MNFGALTETQSEELNRRVFLAQIGDERVVYLWPLAIEERHNPLAAVLFYAVPRG